MGTYYLLPTTYYLLPTTYYLLPTTYYLTNLELKNKSPLTSQIGRLKYFRDNSTQKSTVLIELELDWDSQLKDIIGGYVKDGDVAVNLGSENALSDYTKEDKGLPDMYPMVWAALVQTLRQGHT